MINVVCILWGDKFPEAYAQNLKSMVERNTTVPHRFICLSDRQIEGVETKNLRPGFSGWWNKLQIFDGSIKGRVVYLDLDTVITNNIDWLLNYKGPFAGIEDLGSVNAHQKHLCGVLQSAVMTFESSKMDWIWFEFMMKQQTVMQQFRGDGEYLHSIVPSPVLLQSKFPGQIKSYKYQIYPDNIGDTSIVCFHGRPSIIQAMNESVTTPMRTYDPQDWVKDYWR